MGVGGRHIKLVLSYNFGNLYLNTHQFSVFKLKLLYFSIDNAHLMYNVHLKLFRHSF
jgi:hypothetical protein